MEDKLNSPVGIQSTNNSDSPPNDGEQPKLVPEADYKNLQSEYTRSRQALIEKAVKLAEKNPESLIEESDESVRNAVVKRLYNVENYKDFVSVYGEDFLKKGANDGGNDDEDDVTKLRRELMLMKTQTERKEFESAVSLFKKANQDLFTSAEKEEEFRQSLDALNPTISLEKRIEMASRITFWATANPVADAYKDMASGVKANGQVATSKTNDEKSSREKELRKLFGLK